MITKRKIRLISKTAILLIFSFSILFPITTHAIIPIVISEVQVVRDDISVVITWTTNVPTTGKVEFGKTSETELFIQAGYAMRRDHRITLYNLESETEYFYKLKSTNSETSTTTFNQKFKTLKLGATGLPIISDVRVVYVTGTSVTLQWKSDEPSTSSVEFGKTDAYGSSRGSSSKKTVHDLTIRGLAISTKYHFRVSSRDVDGFTAKSNDIIVKTSLTGNDEKETLIIIDQHPISSTDASIGAVSTKITWQTNKLATGDAIFNGSRYKQEGPRSFNHEIIVPTEPNSSYVYKVRSTDVFGKTIESLLTEFSTLSITDADLDLHEVSDSSLLFYASYDTGTQANYAKGNKLPSTSGSVSITDDGKYNGALNLRDGQLSYTKEDNIELNKGTIAFWFKPSWNPNDGIKHTLFTLNNSYSRMRDKYFIISKEADVLGEKNPMYFGIENTRDSDFHLRVPNSDIKNGKWTHVAATWEYNGQMVLYADGMPIGSIRAAGNAPDFGEFMYVGAIGDNTNSLIDDLAIYNSPLTVGEIRNLAANGPVEISRSHEAVRVLGVSTDDDLKSKYTKETALYKSPNESKVYAILNGKKYHIPNATSFIEYGYNWGDIKIKSQEEINRIPNVRLVTTPETSKVYHLYHRFTKRLKWHLASPEIFGSYPENKWSNLVIVSQQDIEDFPSASLVSPENSNDVYLINFNTSSLFSSLDAFLGKGYVKDDIVEINMKNLEWFRKGISIE